MAVFRECGFCAYFQDESDMLEKGICKRFPPGKGERSPVVSKADWCGEGITEAGVLFVDRFRYSGSTGSN